MMPKHDSYSSIIVFFFSFLIKWDFPKHGYEQLWKFAETQWIHLWSQYFCAIATNPTPRTGDTYLHATAAPGPPGACRRQEAARPAWSPSRPRCAVLRLGSPKHGAGPDSQPAPILARPKPSQTRSPAPSFLHGSRSCSWCEPQWE